MDVNEVELCGRVVAPAELRVTTAGDRTLRILVVCRNDAPPRIDVVPAMLPDPDPDARVPEPGDRVRVRGRLQRMVDDAPNGRRSRLEVVARSITPEGTAAGVG